MATQPCQGQHHQLKISGAQEGYFIEDACAIRGHCSRRDIPSEKAGDRHPVFTQILRGHVRLRAPEDARRICQGFFLHHVVFPQPATPATIKEPLLDTCSSAKRQASCSCEPEKSSQGPTNSGTRCGIQVGKKKPTVITVGQSCGICTHFPNTFAGSRFLAMGALRRAPGTAARTLSP